MVKVEKLGAYWCVFNCLGKKSMSRTDMVEFGLGDGRD